MDDPNAAAAVVAVPETWHVNPYHGKFNPSTKAGQEIFEKKTKGLPADKRFTATKKYSQGICSSEALVRRQALGFLFKNRLA